MNLYTVYDRKAEYCLPVFQARSDAEATRQFAKIVVESDTDVAKYPADFDLVRLGMFDTRTGFITPEHPVGLVINGLVSLQNTNLERARYRGLLEQQQMDIDDVLADARDS